MRPEFSPLSAENWHDHWAEVHIRKDVCFSLHALLQDALSNVGYYGESEHSGASLAKH